MASSTLSTSSAFTTRAPVASRRSSSSRPARALRVLAAQDKQTQGQAPKDAILKTFGAVAAAQMLMSGAALADLLPPSAQSGAARDAVNERTSNLPSFSDVGASLKKSLGQNDPKDIGRAIDNNTPDLPDLTKNPKQIGQDIKRGAQKAVGDLSDLPNPKQALNDAKKTAKNIGNDIGANLGGSNAADKLGGKAKNAANSADKKVKNAVDGLSDLPELPNPFKGSADPENLAKDAKNKAGSLGKDIAKNVPTKEDIPNLGGGLDGNARDAGGKVKRAAEKIGDALPGTGGRGFPETKDT